jgi:hypothetical protein
MNEGKELLCGRILGIFYHPLLVLTNRRLIIGERSISLSDIVGAYSKEEKLQSKMVIELKDGKTEELAISSGKVLVPSSESINAQGSQIRARSKATTKRWVNLLNECLSNIQETKVAPYVPNQELPAQLTTKALSQISFKDDDQIARFVKAFSRPISKPASQDNVKCDDTHLREK